MTNANSLSNLLNKFGIDTYELPFKKACNIQKQWLRTFASNAKGKTRNTAIGKAQHVVPNEIGRKNEK